MAAHDADQEAGRVDDHSTSKTHALIRALANHVADLSAASGEVVAADSCEVILQAEVDDLRCILMRRADVPNRPLPALSPREREIARLIAQGHQNKVVADRLQISVWTVNTHVRRIFNKFGVTSRAAMARYIAQLELIG